MRFDDRLRTVLDQPASDPHDRAVRWRQLVDLLARAGPATDSPLARAALQVIRDDAGSVDDHLRGAAARAVAALPLPFELIAMFAADGLKVSAPILAAAKLSSEQWSRLLDRSDNETKKFILALHPEAERRRFPRDDKAPAASPLPLPQVSISEVIARIESLREHRERGDEPVGVPSLDPPRSSPMPHPTSPTIEPPRLFRWECNTAGEFAWVDGAPRGALIGRALIDAGQLRGNGNDEIARAFLVRAPFRNAVMNLGDEELLAGEWQVSGVPAFEPSSGRFEGYRGIARKTAVAEPEIETPHPHSLRELVHEIKTPLNAIMGFAEIIERQMFGPADAAYRARAAEIVAQSHLLLSALDDLDFAAKSRSSAGPPQSVNLGELVERLIPAVRERAMPRGVEVEGSRTTRDTQAAVDPELAERLIMRLCELVIAQASSGERLRLLVERNEDQCRVSITRPAAYWGLSDELLFGSGSGRQDQNFWLRLTRGLAQIAGGDLITAADTIALLFPRASLGSAGTQVYGSRTGQGL